MYRIAIVYKINDSLNLKKKKKKKKKILVWSDCDCWWWRWWLQAFAKYFVDCYLEQIYLKVNWESVYVTFILY